MSKFYSDDLCRWCGKKLINGARRFCNRKCRIAQIEKGKKNYIKHKKQLLKAIELSGTMFDYEGNSI